MRKRNHRLSVSAVVLCVLSALFGGGETNQVHFLRCTRGQVSNQRYCGVPGMVLIRN